MSRMTDEEFERRIDPAVGESWSEAEARRARAREAELERDNATLHGAIAAREEEYRGALSQAAELRTRASSLGIEAAELRAALSASQERERVQRKALEVAQRWLSNCAPLVELDGPKPLPLIAAALQSPPTPAPEPSRCANCPHPYRCRAGCDLASPPAPESEREKRLANFAEVVVREMGDHRHTECPRGETCSEDGGCEDHDAGECPDCECLVSLVDEARAALSKSQEGER